jgi:2,3-bisphosphoglycerate-independent phosphoglycerate mutase
VSGPLVLIVLDGWGIRAERDNNAIALARTPVYDEILQRYPNAALIASGEAVGLPPGQMGNSEVGHMNMGAGRIVYQDLTRIDKSISDGELFTNPSLLASLERCVSGQHALHFIGLVSDGGVHSHQRHLHALIELAARHRIPNVFIHAITDGRDSSPNGAQRYLTQLQDVMQRFGCGRLATITGRYYAMDRDKRWERTKLAYDAMMHGIGAQSTYPVQAVQASYAAGVTDEFIKPIVVTNADSSPVAAIGDGDSIVFFNFRADRARQLTRAIALDEFDGFERRQRPRVHYTTMTVYDRTFGLPVVFTPQTFEGNFADVLEAHGRTNLRLAETEKYAHVTYFFNCGREAPYAGEERILVASQKVATYDLMPQMSAPGITEQLLADLSTRAHEVIICNFANADMVGHTGSVSATVTAVETLDECLGRILKAVHAAGGTAIVTADHGNAEQMWDDQLNGPHTAHTSNPVPVVLFGEQFIGRTLRHGSLRDVAPTMLRLLGIEKAREMDGASLLVE